MSATATIQVLRPTMSHLVIVRKTFANPLQCDLFVDEKKRWEDGYIAATKRFADPFYPSEVTAIFEYCPASSKWYGNVYKKMVVQGLKKTGKWRNSPTKSRAGGTEFQWTWETV